jgi:hypothetical protein
MSSKCGKNTFATEAKARDVASHVLSMGRAKQQRSYYCQRCKGYHLTSMSLKMQRQVNGSR